MNIHEYQAKAVLHEFGVPVPRGIPAFSVEEAVKGAQELGGPVWVVKAQIHAGGRGKAGGVKVVKSIDDVKKNQHVSWVQLRHASDRSARQEGQPPLYRRGLGDRSRVLLIGADRSRNVARRLCRVHRRRHGHRRSRAQDTRKNPPSRSIRPRASCRITVAVSRRCSSLQAILPSRSKPAAQALFRLHDEGMSLLEINPLVVTKDDKIICLDAKVGFDGNALYRHPDIVTLRDLTEKTIKKSRPRNTT